MGNPDSHGVLKLLIWAVGLIAIVTIIVGAALVVMGATAATEFTLFGQSFRSKSVGLGVIVAGLILAGTVYRQLLSALVQILAGRDEAERETEASPIVKPSDKDIERYDSKRRQLQRVILRTATVSAVGVVVSYMSLSYIRDRDQIETELRITQLCDSAYDLMGGEMGHITTSSDRSLSNEERVRLQQAWNLTKQILLLDARSPCAFSMRAIYLVKHRRYEEARQAAEKARTADPDYARAWWTLSGVYLRMERVPDAIATARRATELAPSEPHGHLNLGQALLSSGDTLGAITAFENLTRTNPTLLPGWELLATTLHSAKWYDRAETAYREYLAMAPDSLGARFNFGELLRQQGKTEEAIDYLQGVCREDALYKYEMLERVDLVIGQVVTDSLDECEAVARIYVEEME